MLYFTLKQGSTIRVGAHRLDGAAAMALACAITGVTESGDRLEDHLRRKQLEAAPLASWLSLGSTR